MVNIHEETTTQEFHFKETITIDCKNCLITIADFANAINFSRRTWCIAKNKLLRDIENILNVNMWGEIYCACDKFLGFELNENEWLLIKGNVELNH